MSQPGSPEPWVNVDACAEHIGVSVPQLYSLNHRGEGPPAVRVGRRLKSRLTEVDAWLEGRRVYTEQPA